MKYKVGDKVRVRSDLVVNKVFGGFVFTPDMQEYSRTVFTIISLRDGGGYYLGGVGHARVWTDEMLEDVEEEFKLPENGRWCIKATKDNVGILGDYWDKGCGLHEVYSHESTIRNDVGKYWCSYNLASGNLLFSDSPGSNHIIEEKPNGLLEITFDQFKKYVLKESESIPVKEEVKFEAWKSNTALIKFALESLAGLSPCIQKGEYKSPTNESDFPIISTKRIINFSQLT